MSRDCDVTMEMSGVGEGGDPGSGNSPYESKSVVCSGNNGYMGWLKDGARGEVADKDGSIGSVRLPRAC